MIRRIVGCQSCQKRFATLRGSTLCPSCRPKLSNDSQPPELTCGGMNLKSSTTSQQENANEALLPPGEDAQASIIMMGNLGGDSSNIAISSGDDDDDDKCNTRNIHHLVDTHQNVPRAMDREGIEHTIMMEMATKKRRQTCTTASLPLVEGIADECKSSSSSSSIIVNTSVLHPLHTQSVDPSSFHPATNNHDETEAHTEDFHVAKKRKIDGEDVPSTEGEVLIVDTVDEENCKERNKTKDRKEDAIHNGDDSEIVWLGTSPSTNEKCDTGVEDVADSTTPRKLEYNAQFEFDENVDVQVGEFDDSHGFYKTHCNNDHEAGNTKGGCALFDGDCLQKHDSSTMQQFLPSPRKDVCYICGSDLSRLKAGLRGRVAHMKRCSAKNNAMPFRGSWTVNDHEDSGDDIESSVAVSKPDPSRKHTERISFNANNNDQWHKNMLNSQPKQTVLRDFFKAPVKCLTNVLMAGARQVAKREASMKTAIKAPSRNGKESNPNSRWSSNNRRNGSCPNYKRIPGTDFICDGFQFATRTLSENYFLTHFHSDHYGGIAKNWCDGIIYCSLPTANLVHQQLRVEKKFLHPIPLNTPTTITSKGKSVVVTLFDANHCPGAVMFLFEIGNRKILHVGDFRFNRDLMMQVPQLLAFSNGSSRLDEIFLDTTYCDTKYTLPTQKDAISAAIEVAEKEMIISNKDKTTKTLFLFGSYTIGKERIYMSVAKHLKMKVYVDSRRHQILSSLEWPKELMQIFTMDKSETNLWVVPLGSVNFKQMPDYLEEANKNKVFVAPYGRVVGFRPTGWTYKGQVKGQTTLAPLTSASSLITSKISGRYSIHGVPYSEHSSFPELVDCLDCLKPKKITPTVSVSRSQELVELLLNAQRGKSTRNVPDVPTGNIARK